MSDGHLPSSGSSSILPLSNLQLILDSLPVGVIAFDPSMTIRYSNPKAGELIERSETIDASISNGSDRPSFGAWKEFFESVLHRCQGRRIPSLRYTTQHRKNLLNLVCTPLFDPESGRVVAGAVILEDITSSNEIQQQLAQAERLATVGKVAGKVAHELNNPLDGILRYINLALRVLEQGNIEKAREYLGQSRTGLMRMVQIVSEMLEFSRSGATTMELSPVDKIIHDAVLAMEPKTGGVRIDVKRRGGEPLPGYRSDSLFQVFCNLIKNAIDAMDGDGTLTIAVGRNETILEIAFIDTGTGFSPEYTREMFEPFFTTKGLGHGTGLGLAICRDIVAKLGGTITAANNPERGSTFTVALPIPKTEKGS